MPGLFGKIYDTLAKDHFLFYFAIGLIILIILAILAGITLDRFGIPPVAQPVHLLIATLIFGVQFFIYICLSYSRNP